MLYKERFNTTSKLYLIKSFLMSSKTPTMLPTYLYMPLESAENVFTKEHFHLLLHQIKQISNFHKYLDKWQ